MGIIRNAWEVDNDEQMLLALAGRATREDYLQNRRERATQVTDL
jgi:hypothetical protein